MTGFRDMRSWNHTRTFLGLASGSKRVISGVKICNQCQTFTHRKRCCARLYLGCYYYYYYSYIMQEWCEEKEGNKYTVLHSWLFLTHSTLRWQKNSTHLQRLKRPSSWHVDKDLYMIVGVCVIFLFYLGSSPCHTYLNWQTFNLHSKQSVT